jgi:hypothetical protein
MWTSDPLTNLELARNDHRERIDDAARRREAAAGVARRSLRDRITAALHRCGSIERGQRRGSASPNPCRQASALT